MQFETGWAMPSLCAGGICVHIAKLSPYERVAEQVEAHFRFARHPPRTLSMSDLAMMRHSGVMP